MGWANPEPPPVAFLPDGEVHLCWISLDQLATCTAELVQVLSPDERARGESFCFERDRNRFIIGRALLRNVLGAYLDREPRTLRFRYGIFGKPSLDSLDDRSICFNLSHSHGLALYALARNCEIGVDVERVRHVGAAEKIAARHFSAHDYAALRLCPKDENDEAFLTCWTRYEALAKARGDGLRRDVPQFKNLPSPGKTPALFSGREVSSLRSRWQVCGLKTVPGYVAALAVETGKRQTGKRRLRWVNGFSSSSAFPSLVRILGSGS